MMAMLRTLLSLLLMVTAIPALAQTAGDVTTRLDGAASELGLVDGALDTKLEQGDRTALRARAQAVRATTLDAAQQLTGDLARIDARLAQLGPAASGEDPAIRSERTALARQRTTIDSATKRAKLLSVEAQQLIDEIQEGQAAEISQKWFGHGASPLTPTFWSAIFRAVPRDAHRIERFVAAEVGTVAAATPGRMWLALLGFAIAILLLGPARLAAGRVGQRLLIEGAPGRRVRRSANALGRVFVGTLAPLLAAVAVLAGLRWAGLVAPSWSAMLDQWLVAIGFTGFTSSVLGAVLMRGSPSWRIAPIGDAVAARLRPYSFLLALLAGFAIAIDAGHSAIGTSAAARTATAAVLALAHILLIAAALFAIGRLRAEASAGEDAPARTGLAAVTLFAWCVAGVALLALAAGYIGFGLSVGQMAAWTLVLGAAVYLALAAIDDVATTVFERSSPLGLALTRGLGLRGGTVDQFGVLLSGVLRVLLAVLALALWLLPFGGSGVADILTRLGDLARGVQVGGVTISPGAILRSVLVLAIGLTLVRGFMRWLEGRYLPATELDGSGRNSVSLVARYVGIALAVIWALASLGIGVERIALLLSALSVGIGFGLQAITQNFVSGLILLAERPIKIGDLIRVGTDEGDVKRISVRSTEITLADHSTLIVPNSELITKSVLNKTLASPLGRIQVQFSVPINVDAAAVQQLVMDAFAREAAVLTDPAPAAFIDAIVNDRIAFNCFGHVESPRAAYRARSNILLDLLTRFRAEGIEMGTVPQRLELVTASPGDPVPPLSVDPAGGTARS
ncbi:mechanosensitive ion channel protein [Sphingomonas sp. Leaf67]|nr:mechanosensitive ion channel protein [Sphingomonas sp. Leaf67]